MSVASNHFAVPWILQPNLRLRLACDGRCAVYSRVYILDEQKKLSFCIWQLKWLSRWAFLLVYQFVFYFELWNMSVRRSMTCLYIFKFDVGWRIWDRIGLPESCAWDLNWRFCVARTIRLQLATQTQSVARVFVSWGFGSALRKALCCSLMAWWHLLPLSSSWTNVNVITTYRTMWLRGRRLVMCWWLIPRASRDASWSCFLVGWRVNPTSRK